MDVPDGVVLQMGDHAIVPALYALTKRPSPKAGWAREFPDDPVPNPWQLDELDAVVLDIGDHRLGVPSHLDALASGGEDHWEGPEEVRERVDEGAHALALPHVDALMTNERRLHERRMVVPHGTGVDDVTDGRGVPAHEANHLPEGDDLQQHGDDLHPPHACLGYQREVGKLLLRLLEHAQELRIINP